MDGDDGDNEYGGQWHPLYAYSRLSDLGMEKTAKFCLYHSRTLVKTLKLKESALSRLAVADKLAVVYTPLWMYCSGELEEYMQKEGSINPDLWKLVVDEKCIEFVKEWKDKAYAIQQY